MREAAEVTQVGHEMVPVVVIGPPLIGPVVAMLVTDPPPALEVTTYGLASVPAPDADSPDPKDTFPAMVLTVPDCPVVLWLSVGKSAATAILGTPVEVVFLRMPVARPDISVPLISFALINPPPVPEITQPAPHTSPWPRFVPEPIWSNVTGAYAPAWLR